jgi:hypothetical protein
MPDVSPYTDVGAIDHADRDVEHVDNDMLEAKEDESHNWEMKNGNFGNSISSMSREPDSDTDCCVSVAAG